MTAFWSKLQQTLPKALGSMSALLSPSVSTCLICGKIEREAAKQGFLTLCSACSGAIPWITRIICPVCGRPEQCTDCMRRTDSAFLLNRSAVKYNPTIRQWLALYKYRGHEALEPLLGEMLAIAYRRLMKELFMRDASIQFDAFIPVPVSDERLLERSFNQAERLASYLAEQVNIPVHEVLCRMRHSDKQSFKTRGARLRDSQNLFDVDHQSVLSLLDQVSLSVGRPIRLLIIDDIYTTGSTVNACAAALLRSIGGTLPKAKAEIFILTLARS